LSYDPVHSNKNSEYNDDSVSVNGPGKISTGKPYLLQFQLNHNCCDSYSPLTHRDRH